MIVLHTSFLSCIVTTACDKKYLMSAEKMANCYNQQKITKTFGVGEHVSVRVPQIDWMSSDLPRLPCMIVQIKGKVNKSYCLIISRVTGFFF